MSIISTYLTRIISAILTGKPVNPFNPADAAPHFEAWNLQLLRHRCAQLSDTFLHVVSNQLPGHGTAKQPRCEHGGEGSIKTNSDMCFTENPWSFGVEFSLAGEKNGASLLSMFFANHFLLARISRYIFWIIEGTDQIFTPKNGDYFSKDIHISHIKSHGNRKKNIFQTWRKCNKNTGDPGKWWPNIYKWLFQSDDSNSLHEK